MRSSHHGTAKLKRKILMGVIFFTVLLIGLGIVLLWANLEKGVVFGDLIGEKGINEMNIESQKS